MKLAVPPDSGFSEEHANWVLLSSCRTSSETFAAWEEVAMVGKGGSGTVDRRE